MKTNLLQTCLLAAALLALPAAVQAQFTYTINTDGITVTITGYTGTGGAVTIPGTLNGLPVTSIGGGAFYECEGLTSVTIPNSVTSVGDNAFDNCFSLTSVTIGNGVTSIRGFAFAGCTSLTAITVTAQNPAYSSRDGVLFDKNQTTLIQYPAGSAASYTIPNSVIYIGDWAFAECDNLTNVNIGNGVTSIGDNAFAHNGFAHSVALTSVTIPNSVTNIGEYAFYNSYGLISVYFLGNAPAVDSTAFSIKFFDNNPYTIATAYHLPGTTGWDDFSYTNIPAVLWLPQVQTGDASFGVRTNQFGFNIAWASGQTVVVEACSNLANPVWQSVQTNTLTSDSVFFSDPQWANYPARFYRLRSP